MEKIPVVYIMASRYKGTLYVGVTSNLMGRVYQHKNGLAEGFTKKYDCKKLVYYEVCSTMEEAITREKQMKVKGRAKKIEIVTKFNPGWKDLYENMRL